MARRRRRRGFKRKAVAGLVALAALVWTVQRALEFFRTREGRWIAGAFAIAFLMLTVRRWRHGRRVGARMNAVEISTDPRDYIIALGDYKRGSPKENHYRKIMQLTLLATYQNRCAKCGVDDNGLDLDHFFLPKNEGGSFIMRHRDGFLVNNAVPLCESCNRSKSDRPFADFFDAEERLRIFEKNVALTRRLNERSLLDEAGNVSRRAGGVPKRGALP